MILMIYLSSIPNFLPYLTFYHVGVRAFLEQVLVVVQNQLISLHRLPSSIYS
jgi:hypothetical protein